MTFDFDLVLDLDLDLDLDFDFDFAYLHSPCSLFPRRWAHEGTLEYTSRDCHLGCFSRRGDIEVTLYNLIEWLGGKLPWEDWQVNNVMSVFTQRNVSHSTVNPGYNVLGYTVTPLIPSKISSPLFFLT